MANITAEEVLKLAKSSRIHLSESEVKEVQAHLGAVLNYAERVSEISGNVVVASAKNINVTRLDAPIFTDSQPILAQAPEADENYFVVLPILEK